MNGKSTLLITAAHFDDELLGSFGAILSAKKKDWDIHIIWLTKRNYEGSEKEIELMEEFCKLYKITPHFYKKEDRSSYNTKEEDNFKYFIREKTSGLNIKKVITHYLQDPHPDHEFVSRCTLTFFRSKDFNGDILYAETLLSTNNSQNWHTSNFRPDVVVPLNKQEVQEMIEVFKTFHPNQYKFEYERYLWAQMEVRGYTFGYDYGQTFQIVRSVLNFN